MPPVFRFPALESCYFANPGPKIIVRYVTLLDALLERFIKRRLSRSYFSGFDRFTVSRGSRRYCGLNYLEHPRTEPPRPRPFSSLPR